MKEDITESIVSEICTDFIDTVIVGLEECDKKFPYLIACINCITELKQKQKDVGLEIFSVEVIDILFREVSNYLAD